MSASAGEVGPGQGSDLLADPLYQLNLILWLLQPLPPVGPIRPLLFEAGFSLESIARPLPLPPATLLRMAEAGLDSIQQPVPEAIAHDAERSHWLLLEAKGSSFGPASTTARQGRALLAAGADLRGPLGLPAAAQTPRATVTYVTGETVAGALAGTLATLISDLTAATIETATGAVLGLSRGSDGVYLHDQHPSVALPAVLEALLIQPQRVHELSPDADARPLYFVPWDPSLDQQTDSARHGRSVMQERLRSAALSKIGLAAVPGAVELRVDELLDEATRGMAQVWRQRDQARDLRNEAKRFLRESVGKVGRDVQNVSELPQGAGIRMDLASEDERDALLDRLRVPVPSAAMVLKGAAQLELPLDEGQTNG